MDLARLLLLVALGAAAPLPPRPAPPSLSAELDGLLRTIAVSGREGWAMRYVRARLGALPVRTDALGDLTLTVGSGMPRRLLACPMDEAGYVVSGIQDDGYLRLDRVGRPPRGALVDQFVEGQTAEIVTRRGPVPAAVGVRSTHLHRSRAGGDPPFTLDDAYVDVGAGSAADVRALGIRILDPVALLRRPTELAGGLVAAPAAARKAACMALVDAARRAAGGGVRGTAVFAWTTREIMGRKGLEHVVAAHGPFQEALLASDGFGWTGTGRDLKAAPLPEPGSGPLAAGAAATLTGVTTAPHLAPPPAAYTGGPAWSGARVGYIGLPTRYADTPVETVALADVARLADVFLMAAGGKASARAKIPPLSQSVALVEPATAPADSEAAGILGSLVEGYGVSGHETQVREAIRSRLPAWAHPQVDAKGNLYVTVGSGPPHTVFVAHMDEVGFVVDSIRPDGRLVLGRRGGFYPSLWEAQAALVQTPSGAVPGVFEPREGWRDAERREPESPLTVDVGTTSASATETLGVRVGQQVTMPKRMFRIGPHRVLARAFDDRVGDTAQLLAIRALDPAAVKGTETFAWVVEEEIGLFGSRALAAEMPDVSRVYAVDTFVSADAPLESPRFADQPLGAGAVVRVIDSSNVAPEADADRVLGLAHSAGIPIQAGMTNGGNDGAVWLAGGAVDIPLSWPGRYSHSPVEVADLGDVRALADLIAALATR